MWLWSITRAPLFKRIYVGQIIDTKCPLAVKSILSIYAIQLVSVFILVTVVAVDLILD